MAPTAKQGTSKDSAVAVQYRYVGDHAQILEGGQPVGPGDYVTLDSSQITGINQMLLDDGKLIDASDYTPESTAQSEAAPEPTTEEKTA